MKRVQEISWQLQQRVIVHFCVKLGWNFTQIKTSLRTCFPRVLCDASLYHWIKEFQGGRARIVDVPRASKAKSARSRANIRRVENVITNDRRVTVREISNRTAIPFTCVQRILKFDLEVTKKCAKFVPAVLTDRHLSLRRDVCSFMIRLLGTNPRAIRNCVTVDESCIYFYDPELKVQSKTWLRKGEDRPQKPRRTIATAKIMIVTFFDSHGLIYFEYVQKPLTVNQRVWRAILRRFTEAHIRRHPQSSVQGRKFIHFDNAPAHNATDSVTLLHQLGWTRIPHPPCSPDLAPNDFWLYPRLKRNLRGIRFSTVEELKDAVNDEISSIPSEDYKNCIMNTWPCRWRACLAHQGQFFEGMT